MILTNRIIKIISCFAVIAMVLVVSLTVPVKAASTIYRPKDYIYRTVYDGNNELIYYRFEPYGFISLKENNSGNVTNTYGNAYVEPLKDLETYIFRIYPFGSSFVPGRNMDDTSCVVDVSDFKSDAFFELSCSFSVELAYAYTSYSSGDTTLSFDNSGYVCFYDKDGYFLSSVSIEGYKTDIVIPDQGPVSSGGYAHLFDYKIPLTVPEGAAYLMPCLLSSFTVPNWHVPHILSAINVSAEAFVLTANKNLLIEQSETLKAVEEQMDELNNKADTIINGTPELQQGAQNALWDTQDNDEEFDELMAQLDALDDTDTSTVMGAMQDFLDADGWKDLRTLVAPVLDWSHFTTIALIVLALVNLSIILFGR